MDRRRVGKAPPPRRTGGPRKPRLDFDDVMYGIHVVEEAMNAGEELRAIHVSEDRKRDPLLQLFPCEPFID